MNKLTTLINRLAKIGVNVKLGMNYPWVYVISINDKRVTEKYRAEHGWTIGFMPIRINEDFKFTDTHKFFELLRKYL